MTIEEARKLAEKEEKICQTCDRYVCRICMLCDHNSEYVAHVPFQEKMRQLQDETLNNYR